MPETLQAHEFRRRGRPKGSKYDRYLDGQIHKLKLGEDCPATVASARAVIRSAADKFGVNHRTDATSEPGHLIIQAFDKTA